jgi:hypothetical protein
LFFRRCTYCIYASTYIPSIAVDVDYIEFFQDNKNPSGREVFVFPVGPPARKHFQLTDYRRQKLGGQSVPAVERGFFS